MFSNTQSCDYFSSQIVTFKLFVPGTTPQFHFCSPLLSPLLALVKQFHPTSSGELCCCFAHWRMKLVANWYDLFFFCSNFVNLSNYKPNLSSRNAKLPKLRKIYLFFLPEALFSLFLFCIQTDSSSVNDWTLPQGMRFCMLLSQ